MNEAPQGITANSTRSVAVACVAAGAYVLAVAGGWIVLAPVCATVAGP